MNTVNPAKIHQYRVQILYKPGPEIFIAYWLSCHNHKENKDEPIQGMDIRVDAIQSKTDVPECMSILQIQQPMAQDGYLQWLKNNIISGWPATKDQLHLNIRPYWSYKDDLAVIDDIIMKGRCIIISEVLKQQVLDQLHVNLMGIKKIKLLVHESIYWVNIINDIENYVGVDYKNDRIFTLKGISNNIVLVSVMLKSSCSKLSQGARKIIEKAERQLL